LISTAIATIDLVAVSRPGTAPSTPPRRPPPGHSDAADLDAPSVRIAEDEAKWLSVAAGKGGVSQNDLIRLALVRLRKELGAASRVKPETVLAVAKASKYKLSPAPAGRAIRAARGAQAWRPIACRGGRGVPGAHARSQELSAA
jgi:hypothetical protein